MSNDDGWHADYSFPIDVGHLPGGYHNPADEFNEHAPYGLEHRREMSFSFQLAKDNLKEVVSVLFGEDAKQVTYKNLDRLLKPWPAIQ